LRQKLKPANAKSTAIIYHDEVS